MIIYKDKVRVDLFVTILLLVLSPHLLLVLSELFNFLALSHALRLLGHWHGFNSVDRRSVIAVVIARKGTKALQEVALWIETSMQVFISQYL